MDYAHNPKLRKYFRDFSIGEFLFEEGYLGDTLYLIIEGTIGVYKKTATGKRLLYSAADGDVVGEKAIISEPGFKRDSSAQAKTSVAALEFDRRAFQSATTLITDLPMKMLKTVELRVDQAQVLIALLYSTNEVDRITEYIKFFFKFNKKFGKSLQIGLDDITSATNTDANMVQKVAEELTKKGILKALSPGYILIDAVALTQYAPELRERLAA